MADAQGVIHAPIVARIAEEIYALIKSDAALRRIQGANAPQAYYFDRQIALATLYTIVQARSGNGEIFSTLVINFDVASAAGFWRIDGVDASATTGVEIPAGGGILTIQGHDNIKNFSMITSGAGLTFSRYLFK
jgi:hypothetical protein